MFTKIKEIFETFKARVLRQVVPVKGDIEMPVWKWHLGHLGIVCSIAFVLIVAFSFSPLWAVIIASAYAVVTKLRQGNWALLKGHKSFHDAIADWSNAAYIWVVYAISTNVIIAIVLFIIVTGIYVTSVVKEWANP